MAEETRQYGIPPANRPPDSAEEIKTVPTPQNIIRAGEALMMQTSQQTKANPQK